MTRFGTLTPLFGTIFLNMRPDLGRTYPVQGPCKVLGPPNSENSLQIIQIEYLETKWLQRPSKQNGSIRPSFDPSQKKLGPVLP